MHFISIQIQPEFLPIFDRYDFLTRANTLERSPEIDEYEEKGKRYLNFTFFTEKPTLLWQDLQTAFYNHRDYSAIIRPISIAICESDSGDTVLLLHHFDSTEKLDQLI